MKIRVPLCFSCAKQLCEKYSGFWVEFPYTSWLRKEMSNGDYDIESDSLYTNQRAKSACALFQ